jgi:hypothetical protein
MNIKMTFFEEDEMLAAGVVRCLFEENEFTIQGGNGYIFQIKASYEEPACPVFIKCFLDGKLLYRSALRMGVHSSDDWETIELANNHLLIFKCYVNSLSNV